MLSAMHIVVNFAGWREPERLKPNAEDIWTKAPEARAVTAAASSGQSERGKLCFHLFFLVLWILWTSSHML